MPAKAPDGFRWCKTCGKYRPVAEFGNSLNAYCHPHWLVWNREKAARFREGNPGYEAERARQRAEANPDKVRQKNKKWAAEQKAAGYPYLKKWIAKNPERARKIWRDKGRAWRLANPEKAAAQRHRKRARKSGAPGHHTGADLLALQEAFGGRCAYCPNEADTWDHVVSMFHGGTNFIWNNVPACRSCNSSKQHNCHEGFLSRRNLCPDIQQYIENSIARHRDMADPDRYVRNPYEKVSEQALWDAAESVFLQNGRVTETGLASTPFSVSTFRRRLGGLQKINAELRRR